MKIFPFKALLPQKGREIEVSANTHSDSIERQKEIVKSNINSYLRVVKPYLINDEEKNPELHFPLAKIEIDRLRELNIVHKNENTSYYLYEQKNNESIESFLGLIALVSVEDYYTGKIKLHENTITEKENQLIEHISYCGVIGEPVLMTHLSSPIISQTLESYKQKSPVLFDFEDEIKRQHTVYTIENETDIKEINNAYQSIESLYIADGHHRSAASAGYFKNKNITNGCYLVYIVPPEYLKIDSFYRTFKANKSFNHTDFLEQLSIDFLIEKTNVPYLPKKEKEFGLCIDNQWYVLDFKHDISSLNAAKKLDVSLLEDNVFKKILGIENSKTDNQLKFINGNIAPEILQKDIKTKAYDAVFSVFPCKIEHVFEVADLQMIMPPKSTYIEPKMRTGLVVQDVFDQT